MRLSGFTFIRNAVKYDFPFREAVESMLPLVDELVVNVGRSEDDTGDLVARLFAQWRQSYPQVDFVRIDSVWDDTKIDSGLVLSEQTNLALDRCTGDWCLYLQADEALHEGEHATVRQALQEAAADPGCEGLRLRYLHFYGGYSLVQRAWNWYPSEIRLIRKSSGARSFGDAQTFKGPGDRPLKTRLIGAHVFHYGHARHPDSMKRKISYFHRFWHGDDHGIKVEAAYNLKWKDLSWYWGSHPAPYEKRAGDGLAWSPRAQGPLPRQVFLLLPPDGEAAAPGLIERLIGAGCAIHAEQTLFGLLRALWRRMDGPIAERAFVDLGAGRRPAILTWALGWLARFFFGKSLAVSAGLAPPSWAASGYNAIAGLTHENKAEGFAVPPASSSDVILRSLSGPS